MEESFPHLAWIRVGKRMRQRCHFARVMFKDGHDSSHHTLYEACCVAPQVWHKSIALLQNCWPIHLALCTKGILLLRKCFNLVGSSASLFCPLRHPTTHQWGESTSHLLVRVLSCWRGWERAGQILSYTGTPLEKENPGSKQCKVSGPAGHGDGSMRLLWYHEAHIVLSATTWVRPITSPVLP